MTARGDGFAAVLRDLETSGAAAAWPDGSGRARMVGVPGMSALAGAMAAGLDVRQGAQVTAVRPAGVGWRLRVGDAEHRADRVVVTVARAAGGGPAGRGSPAGRQRSPACGSTPA